MKKVAIILSCIAIILSVALILVFRMYDSAKDNNIKLQNDMQVLNGNIENTSKMNESKKQELENTKEENKNKLTELETWKQMKEKIEQSL